MAKLNSILSSRVSKWMGNTMRQSPCQDATARHIPKIPGLGFVFQQDGALHGASSMRHRRFPEAKGAWLRFSNTVVSEFTGSEPKRL